MNANPLQVCVHFVQAFLSPFGAESLQKYEGCHQHKNKGDNFYYVYASVEGLIANVEQSIVLVLGFFDISVDAICHNAGSADHYELREDGRGMENDNPAGFQKR